MLIILNLIQEGTEQSKECLWTIETLLETSFFHFYIKELLKQISDAQVRGTNEQATFTTPREAQKVYQWKSHKPWPKEWAFKYERRVKQGWATAGS